MTPAILFIGMGDPEGAHLEAARKAGFHVLATNRDPDAVTLRAADEGIVVDGTDVPGILAGLAAKGRSHLDAVYTGTELFVTASIVARALGAPHVPVVAAAAGQHKGLARHLLSAAGIPLPRGRALTDADRGPGDIPFPLVVKPADALSSRGVSVVREASAFATAVEEARKASASKVVIVEEFLEGTLLDVNGFMANGRLVPLGATGKAAGSPPRRVVERAWCPSRLPEATEREAYGLLERASLALGIEDGPVKGDFIVSRRGVVVMEVAPRFHGPLGSLCMIPRVFGRSPMEAWLDHLRKPGDAKPVGPPTAHVVVRALPTQAATAAARRLAQTRGDVQFLAQPRGRDGAATWRSNEDVPGYLAVEASDAAKADALAEEILRRCMP